MGSVAVMTQKHLHCEARVAAPYWLQSSFSQRAWDGGKHPYILQRVQSYSRALILCIFLAEMTAVCLLCFWSGQVAFFSMLVVAIDFKKKKSSLNKPFVFFTTQCNR